MARQIFRKEAVERLSAPEQLDQLMQVTSPRSWIALVVFGLLLMLALFWGWFGTISNAVEAQGILIRSGGVISIEAPQSAIMGRILVSSGGKVEKGQKLMILEPATPGAPKPEPILSPFDGRVLERIAREGDPVKAGTLLMLLEPFAEPLLVRLYIPIDAGYQVQRGMSVQIWPANAKKREFGYLLGRVLSASKFPITQSEMLRRVQHEDLARQLSQPGPTLQIIVELTADTSTASGYKWSSPRGENLPLYSGTPCQARIILDEQRPIQLLFPTLGGQGEP